MYPSLDAPAASLAVTGSGGAAEATTTTSSSSYPSTATADGPLFPLLRVQVASKLRVAPQVMLPPLDPDSPEDATAASVVPRSNFAFDFDVERRAVERASPSPPSEGAEASSSSAAAPWTPPDPWKRLFEKHGDCSREEVALAASLAARAAEKGGDDGGDLDKKHLGPLRQLTSMGFSARDAAGALCLSGGDLAAATDACLAAAAAGSSLDG